MRRPWQSYSEEKPWNVKPKFGGKRFFNPDYNTRRWRSLRQSHLNQFPLCAMCEKMGRVTPATMVDHIRSVADGGDMWNPLNFQSLCNHCHRIKTNKEIAKRK